MSSFKKLILFGIILTAHLDSYAKEEKLSRQSLFDDSNRQFNESKITSEMRLQQFVEKRKNTFQELTISSDKKNELLKESLFLEAQFAENDIELKDIEKKIDGRGNDLKTFLGILRDTTLSLRAELKNSVMSTQYPERLVYIDDLLIDLEKTHHIVNFEKLSQFSKEILKEIKGSEEIIVFQTAIINQKGKKEKTNVTRVGSFNITKENYFLAMDPDSSSLSVLQKQPARKFRKYVVGEALPGSDMLPLTIDPTSGRVLSLMMARPTLTERINQGGIIGYLIIFLGITSILLTLVRFKFLSSTEKLISFNESPTREPYHGPLERLSRIAKDNQNESLDVLEIRLQEGLTTEHLFISKRLSYIKFIAIVSPLLGLLGTVSGMIITFQSIALSGTNDPNLMAGGISQALITTVLGLCVAIPSLLFFTVLNEKIKKINDDLEQFAYSFITDEKNE